MKIRQLFLFFFYTLPFLITFFLVSACGLEFMVALNPPKYDITSNTDKFFKILITDENNEDEFRGVEFYYKFYEENDTNLDINLQTKDELVTHGFRRLYSENDALGNVSKPLVKVPLGNRGKHSRITIDFSDIEEPNNPFIKAEDYLAEGGLVISNLSIRRGVVYKSGEPDEDEYKKFSDFYLSDDDLDHIESYLNEGKINTVILLLYTISYGKEDISSTIYSEAICLQDIKLEITISEEEE